MKIAAQLSSINQLERNLAAKQFKPSKSAHSERDAQVSKIAQFRLKRLCLRA